MKVAIEIVYEELVETKRKRTPYWALLKGAFEVELRETADERLRVAATTHSDASGTGWFVFRDDTLWMYMLQAQEGETGARQAVEAFLTRQGLVVPDKRIHRGLRRVEEPTAVRGERLDAIRRLAQEWVDANLLFASGMLFERALFLPHRSPDDTEDMVVVGAAGLADGRRIEIALLDPVDPDAWPETLRSASKAVAWRAWAADRDSTREPGRADALQAAFVDALAERLENGGTTAPDASLALDEATTDIEASRTEFLDRREPSPATTPVTLPRPAIAASGEPHTFWGYPIEERTVLHRTLAPSADSEPFRRIVGFEWGTEAFHDGERFYLRSQALNRAPVRPAPAPDEGSADDAPNPSADTFMIEVLVLGSLHDRTAIKRSSIVEQAVRLDPVYGTSHDEASIGAMLDEFAARRMAWAGPLGWMYSTPEPVLMASIGPDKLAGIEVSWSWRVHAAAVPGDGRDVPFLFPLHAYDDAIAFLPMLDRRPGDSCEKPEVFDASVFSDDFHGWNLKAALDRILSGSKGRLALLDADALAAGLRVARIVDLWRVDVAAADEAEHDGFASDCRVLLDALADPMLGAYAHTAMASAAKSWLDVYRPPVPRQGMPDEDMDALEALGLS